jgi:hypothetical protein
VTAHRVQITRWPAASRTQRRTQAERGWGKPPQFAAIEAEDQLGFSERDAAEFAASFEARLDELAARRAATQVG